MRAIDVFKARHKFAREIFYDDLYGRYTEQQLRTPAHPNMNSLLWILWHVARVEDAGVTRFVTGDEQVLKSGNWNVKLGLDIEHFGFGSVNTEMLEISQKLNISAVREYANAVKDYTMQAVDKLTPERLDEVLSVDEVRRVLFVENVALPDLNELLFIYPGWTRLEALYHFSMTHYYWHGGEVRTIESILNS